MLFQARNEEKCFFPKFNFLRALILCIEHLLSFPEYLVVLMTQTFFKVINFANCFFMMVKDLLLCEAYHQGLIVICYEGVNFMLRLTSLHFLTSCPTENWILTLFT